MSFKSWTILVLLLCLILGTQSASGATRRFVLAAGANSGGDDRVPLRYAVTDAAQFADVMIKMGGVDPSDYLLLEEPNLEEFGQALEQIRIQLSSSSDSVGRREVLFYYSGHADEEGLLLGEERFSYIELRRMMDEVPADVRITVLDACASGAITRIKGGQRRQAFLVDDSSDMEGYAFLTSSSAHEAAQESDQIASSFFTHYLVSGMRGAADVSGDSKVSLTEAYEFAFDETLASTTETRGGAQHPSYEISLSGTGDVVMTDLREISAGLHLAEELSGRFFIRNAERHLVAELYKPAGRVIELGLEPGEYSVYMVQEEELFLGSSTLRTGDRVVLHIPDFRTIDREPTTIRGAWPGAKSGGLSVARRHRLGLHLGYWDSGEPKNWTSDCASGLTTNVKDLMGSFSYGYWAQENLSVNLSFKGLVVESRTSADYLGACERTVVVSSILFGIQYYPLITPSSPLRPYLSAAAGPYIGTESIWGDDFGNMGSTITKGSFGGQLGGGVDLQLGRYFMIDVNVGYNFMSDFSEPLAGKDNFGGVEFGIGISLLLGKGI